MKKMIYSKAASNFFTPRLHGAYLVSQRNKSSIVAVISKPDQFKESRQTFDDTLNDLLSDAKTLMSNNKYHEALPVLETIITLAAGEELNNLTNEERKLIGLAFTYKAEILSYGSFEDVKLALIHLDRALDLTPELNKATELRKSIRSEWLIPADSGPDSDQEKASVLHT